MVFGAIEREDDPMYYSLVELTLDPGDNHVVLDFNANQPCERPGSGKSKP